MRDKRGVFFSLYLVLLTLLMCGLVIGFQVIHQGDITASLISPLAVLDAGDSLTIFEMREVDLIKKSLTEANGEFGTDAFNEDFRDKFIDRFSADSDMTGFVLTDLIWQGKNIKTKSGFDSNTFYENILYPESGMEMDSDKLIFSREMIGKSFSLRALDVAAINFPIDFKFEFERKYLITKTTSGFDVEVD
ncbi:MAG: hypothetical protein OEL87_03385 [Nanoarchaeota archaeon]|nr:hypothetical protein [Nanoarchaeota archaeon]